MRQQNRKAVTKKAVFRRLCDMEADRFTDTRKRQGRRYRNQGLVHALMAGLLSNQSSLRHVETLTDSLGADMRRRLKIPRRISDSKLRDKLLDLDIGDCQDALVREVKAEHRRGNLDPVGFGFGIVAIDGKGIAKLNDWSYPGVQKVHPQDRAPYGLARVHRAFLISSKAAVCLHSREIPGDTNEIGSVKSFTGELLKSYQRTDMFDMVMADAGNCSKDYAGYLADQDKWYVLALKENHGDIFEEAVHGCVGEEESVVTRRERGFRITYRLWRTPDPGHPEWTHLRQYVRVERTLEGPDGSQTVGNRYYATNMPMKRQSGEKWLELIRLYWRVENNGNWTSDAIWKEDRRRTLWTTDGRALYALSVLRMIAQNILAVLRMQTRREWDDKPPPWSALVALAYVIFVSGQTIETDRLAFI